MALCYAIAIFPAVAQALGIFTIESAKVTQPRAGLGSGTAQAVAAPSLFLEVTVKTREQLRSDSLYAKAYYYSKQGGLLAKADRPFPVKRGGGVAYPMPIYFVGSKPEVLLFAVPREVAATKDWQAVVVFGDKHGAAGVVYPRGKVASYDFPERVQVDAPQEVERRAAADTMVEHVVETENTKQPKITLFLCPPDGMDDLSDAEGILAVCLLANNVEEIRRRMLGMAPDPALDGVRKFAKQHNLVILCWGSRSLWDPRKSWDEQSRDVTRELDETFDDVAKAWSKGVNYLSRKYGVPERGFLLWGESGAAQYACRLALRKPEYFLAVHVHIPSSFDKPTPEARRVLWCLTTGENEGGYERSLRFLSACRGLGYPIVYKAIVGLGHQGHPLATRLGLEFFEYALSLREERLRFENEMNRPSSPQKREFDQDPSRPWPVSFRTPAYVGDVVNQQMFQFEEIDLVPASFRTMLPTAKLARTWNQEK